MTKRRQDRNPVQMSLFEQRTVSVSWVAKRWKTGRDTISRLLHSGALRGYRITLNGWWRVIETSVFEYEKKVGQEYGPDVEKGGK